MKCNICGSAGCESIGSFANTHGSVLFDAGERFSAYRCLKCGNIFLGGMTVDSVYYNRYYAGCFGSPRGKENRLGGLWNRLVNGRKQSLMRRYGPDRTGRTAILDVGCGSGDFLASLDPGRYETTGVEISAESVNRARVKGLSVLEGSILDLDLAGRRYDLITMWHVLEHLPRPVEVLKKLRGLLSRDGVLICSVPNNESLGSKWGREWWFHADAPRHIFLPCAKSCRKLARRAGFSVLSIRDSGWEFPLDLFWSLRYSTKACFVYPLYPVFKLFSRECLTFVMAPGEGD